MLLEGRNAVIYGGGGAIGGAVARAFAREGATVHLTGRTQETLDAVAEDIRSRGGVAETAVLDALDEEAVDAHADAMPGLDISFNVITHGDVQGTPLAEMSLADFERPVITAVRTMFITTRAAARRMMRQRSGVILVFGGYGDPPRDHNLGGLQVAFGAQEYLRRNLAAELGSLRHPRADDPDRRRPGLDPRRLRRQGGDRPLDRGADAARPRGLARGRRQRGRLRRLRLGAHDDRLGAQHHLRHRDRLNLTS